MQLRTAAARQNLWLSTLILIACLSFIITLFLDVINEEAVYVLQSLEMMHYREYWVPIMLGQYYHRTPLFNVLIVLFTHLVGKQQIMLAARLVSVIATLATAGTLAWFSQRLLRNKHFTLLTTAIFLSADVLLRHGWLAYSDPLFAYCTFGAIAYLWIALTERRAIYFVPANLLLIAAFLTKAITAYAFYGLAVFVLLWQHRERSFLWLSRTSWLMHGIALIVPILWLMFVHPGDPYGRSMSYDLSSHLWQTNPEIPYWQHLLKVPSYLFLHWLPFSLLALVYAHRTLKRSTNTTTHDLLRSLLWLVGLNILPYWLSQGAFYIRYLQPVYPFVALIISLIVYAAGKNALRLTYISLAITLIVKFAYVGFWVPKFENQYRGNYQGTALLIHTHSATEPVYLAELDAVVPYLNVATYLDLLRSEPVKTYKINQPVSGFIMASKLDKVYGEHLISYTLGKNTLHLYCQGSACSSAHAGQARLFGNARTSLLKTAP